MAQYDTPGLGANGLIHAWTAAGPTATPLRNLDRVLDAEGWAYRPYGRAFLSNVVQSLDHKRRLYSRLPALLPGEPATVESADRPRDGWYPVSADEQGVVDFGLFAFEPLLLRAWLSTELEVDREATLTLRIPAVGPTALHVGGGLVGVDLRFGYVEPFSIDHRIRLAAGRHRITLCGDMVVWREARLTLGARLIGVATDDGGEVRITTVAGADTDGGASTEPAGYGRAMYERVIASLAPEDRRILATPGAIIGAHDTEGATDFRTEPYATPPERAREALEALAARQDSPAAALARVVLGYDERLAPAAVEAACTHLERRFDCADFFALWLHIVLHRDDERSCLPQEDRERIEEALTGFKYWIDEPGLDAMCFFTENHQIIFHTAAHLSGHRFPDALFAGGTRTGRRLAAEARVRLLSWIEARQDGGFSEWDSSAYLAMDAYALLALVEFSPDAEVVEAARRLLDKLLHFVAVQSWRGVHGSSHGRCYVNSLESARFDGTSGLQRIAWGTGGFEGEHWATLLFALSRTYRVPQRVVDAATDLSGITETQVHSFGRYRYEADLRDDPWSVHTMTRRSPHYMLSAALDQRPGDPGIQEHIWQATLGRDALVFTTYPANTAETGHARPNFWAGSARLPRVRMYGRTVIALYDVVATVGLGRTHAHFPTKAFDEWRIGGHRAFARVGTGYVSLWSDGELTLAAEGPGAGRELRTTGGRAWVCWTGSAEEDGSFESFVRERMGVAPEPVEAGVRCADPGGAVLELRRFGPFLVDGIPRSLPETHFSRFRVTNHGRDADVPRDADAPKEGRQ
ncbi:MAG: hypothetical protein ACLFM5_08470 [Spirochaetaceae bacterium]